MDVTEHRAEEEARASNGLLERTSRTKRFFRVRHGNRRMNAPRRTAVIRFAHPRVSTCTDRLPTQAYVARPRQENLA